MAKSKIPQRGLNSRGLNESRFAKRGSPHSVTILIGFWSQNFSSEIGWASYVEDIGNTRNSHRGVTTTTTIVVVAHILCRDAVGWVGWLCVCCVVV